MSIDTSAEHASETNQETKQATPKTWLNVFGKTKDACGTLAGIFSLADVGLALSAKRGHPKHNTPSDICFAVSAFLWTPQGVMHHVHKCFKNRQNESVRQKNRGVA